MTYKLVIDNHCKACLDNILMEFLEHTNKNGLYWDKLNENSILYNTILIDSEVDIQTLRDIISNRGDVKLNIHSEKTLDQIEFNFLKNKMKPYNKSFW